MSFVLNGAWQSKLGPTLNQTRVKMYEPLLDLNLNQPLRNSLLIGADWDG